MLSSNSIEIRGMLVTFQKIFDDNHLGGAWCHGNMTRYGPLARYVQLWVAHAPGMPGTFSPPARVNDPDMHHGTCVTHGT